MKKFNWEEYSTRLVMILVGVICVCLSIYYSTQFYITEFHRPFFVAIMLAGAIGIFNTFSLVAATFLIHHKNYLMAIIFIPIAISAIGFDISTVVGAQSANYIQQEEIEQIAEQKTDALNLQEDLLRSTWEGLKQQRTSLEERLANTVTRLDETERKVIDYSTQYETSLQDITDEGKIISNNYRSAMRSAIIDRDNYKRDVNNLTTQIRDKSLEENSAQENYMNYVNQQVETQNQINEQAEIELKSSNNTMTQFANWLSSVLTFIPKKWIQFILVLIPALFIDLISPIAMNFGLTITKDLQKNAETSKEEIQLQPQVVIEEPRKKRKYTRRIKETTNTEEIEIPIKTEPEIDPVDIVVEVPIVKQVPITFNEPQKLEFEHVTEETEEVLEKYIEPNIKEELVEEETKDAMDDILTDNQQTVIIQEKEIKENSTSTIHYRFGRTTEKIANNLIKFINLCIDKPGKFKMTPEQASKEMNLSARAKVVFLNNLSNLRLGRFFLIRKDKDGDWFANYSAEDIIKYSTDIVS